MKKTYMQPRTDVVNVELTQLMVGSLVENGFDMGDAPETEADSGNLSLDFDDLW